MRRLCHFVVLALLLSAGSATIAQAQLNYGFLVGTGSRMTGSFTILQNGSRAGAGQTIGDYAPSQNTIPIGFTFNFNGATYTQLSVCSNGFLTLGGTYGSPMTNALQNAGAPIIAPFWDQLRVPAGGNSCGLPGKVQYMVGGTAPNRILVVDFQDVSLGDGWAVYAYAPVTFQVRLYETSNKIEFHYQAMGATRPSCETSGGTTAATTGSIGLTTSGGFMSVTPNGSSATASKTTENSSIDLRNATINAGTLYTFCPAGIVGNPSEGGTANMADGDELLSGIQVVLSSSQNFMPFTLASPCASTFTYTITGPQAGDYSISPASGSLPAAGSTPVLTFSPTGIGERQATLTVRDNLGFVVRTYTLAGEGVPRISWVGNVLQGGTAGLVSGDTLMTNVAVDNGSSRSFTPITLQVNGTSGPPAPVTYTLIDMTGQFSIDRTIDNVAPGSSSSPVITFTPSGIGPQEATLIVNAEGEIRTFLLRPFARGAGARFYIGSEPLGAGSAVFQNVYACVGTQVQTVEITVESIGDLPFRLESSDVFQTEYVIRQGVPPYPLLRDEFGNYILLQDYFISDAPGSRTPLQLPITVMPGARRTIYLNFLPTREGKRRARAFFETNGLNFAGLSTEGDSVQGLLNFELVGQGLGSGLSNRGGDDLPDPLVFPPTEVRSTSTITSYIRNTGECDLLLSDDKFRLVSGDISEFEIISGLASPLDAQGNHVIPPGGLDSFTVSFTPTRSGSRRASIHIQSNDSTLVIPGVSARGAYELDVFGVGKVGLEARPITLPPAVIDGPASIGRAVLENTSQEAVTVVNITLIDANGEIVEDPSNTWPAPPLTVIPGQRLTLGLRFTPTSGSTPGERVATIEVTLSNGEVVTIDVKGLAGTRQLIVTPASLFEGLQLDVGDVRRQFVTVTNTGTFPVTIQQLNLTETNPGDYSVSALARSVLEPGQTEFLEVTFSPQAAGPSGGSLEIVSNSTNGPHVVTLGGVGTTIAPIGGGGSGTMIPVTGEEPFVVRPGGISEWSAATQEGVLLWKSSPNPGVERIEIRYYVPEATNIELALYTSNGEAVRNLAADEVKAGQHSVSVDLGDLASGRYFYVLRAGSGVLSLPLDVVK